MDEIILQFSAYYGFAKGEAFQDAADAGAAAMPDVDLDEWRGRALEAPWGVEPVVPFPAPTA